MRRSRSDQQLIERLQDQVLDDRDRFAALDAQLRLRALELASANRHQSEAREVVATAEAFYAFLKGKS